MKQMMKRVEELENKHQSDPKIDYSNLEDEELLELEQLLLKTGVNENYSLLTDKELNRMIELINKAENETN